MSKGIVARMPVPTGVLVVFAVIGCGPTAFYYSVDAWRGYDKVERLVLNFLGFVSCGTWLWSVSTLSGVAKVPFIASSLAGGIVMWIASFAAALLLLLSFLVFSRESDTEDGSFPVSPVQPFVVEPTENFDDQAAELRRRVAAHRRKAN